MSDDTYDTHAWGHCSDSVLHFAEIDELSIDDIFAGNESASDDDGDDIDRWGQSSDSSISLPQRRSSVLAAE